MGRGKHEHCWKHVRRVENGLKWICNYCNDQFSGGATRIEAHLGLDGKGGGIRRCSNYPVAGNEGVNYNIMASTSSNPPETMINRVYSTQDQGVPEMIGTHTRCSNYPVAGNEGVHNNLASTSSNPPLEVVINRVYSTQDQGAEGVPEVIGTHIISSLNHQNSAEIMLLSEGVNGSGGNRSVTESEINQLKQLILDLVREENDVENQLQSLESRGKKRKQSVNVWLEYLQRMKKIANEMNNLNGIHEVDQVMRKMKRHKEEKPFTLSTEFVGEQLDENINEALKLLADDKVFVIGIYGMGGVGKTLLATLVENEVKRKATFKDVFWVTVSHNHSNSKLQQDIAKRIGLKFDEDDERIRAENLSLALEKKGKSILILDDVWQYIDLQKVGIHPKVNGIKVILTTRLQHVCHQMDCQPYTILQMSPLNCYKDGWELFMLKLGRDGTHMTLSPEIEEIVKRVAERLMGLPLAINVVARTMKGIDDIHQWRHALNKLNRLEMGEKVEEEVFKILKRSYDNLMEKDLQNCFLYLALLSVDDCENIGKVELIMKLVDKGHINGNMRLEEIFDEGNTILNTLEAHSLIISTYNNNSVHTHPLVRNMAFYISKENSMLKFNDIFTKKHLSHEWADDLELVHMLNCDITHIPDGMSPNCKKLSTLIINKASISHFPENFFKYMERLSILDLSHNYSLESLPNSVSELRSLVSLVLKGCVSLIQVPPLGELQALSRLVISDTSIEEAPQGLEKLINLKWLDLSRNESLDMDLGSFLSNFTKIQYLDLQETNVLIEVKDIQRMNVLEYLGGAFHCTDYNQDMSFGLKGYHLRVGNVNDGNYWIGGDYINLKTFVPSDHDTRTIVFQDCECDHLSHILPKDLSCLNIDKNNHWVCLCDALSYKTSSSLRRIEIDYCQQLESLFCLSGSCSFCTKIHNLEVLELESLENLIAVCKDVVDVRPSLSPSGIFSCLKEFSIFYSHLIEKLFTPQLVQQLQNLETISVSCCNSMKEIFAVSNIDDNDKSIISLPNLKTISVSYCNSMKEIFAVSNIDDNDKSIISLPKLTRLDLRSLPQLKTVCKGSISYRSSPEGFIRHCPNLERHPNNFFFAKITFY